MKIDRRRPSHWFYLLGFLAQSVIGLLRRKRVHLWSGSALVLLYGHKLNGNLLALYQAMRKDHSHRFRPIFLTMDLAYHRQLRGAGIDSMWAAGWACSRALADANAVVSDHGLHALQPLVGHYKNRGLRFVDVWHGIPFKGFDADDFRVQHRYDEIWVASDLQRELYCKKFGFPPNIVHVTGYARTDRLIEKGSDVDAIKRELGLDPGCCGKLILFAPTWEQDHRGRSMFPFGIESAKFLRALSELAESLGATILLRQHLNSTLSADAGTGRIVHVPYAQFPDTEAIMLASDVLICDWSSIAFDFLLLQRPTFFLDVPAPFRKGYSLGPEYRYGAVVGSLSELITGVRQSLTEPDRYWQVHGMRRMEARQEVYGHHADGQSAARCVERLNQLSCESSR